MADYSMNSQEILIGAILGTLACGALTVMLMRSKTEKKIEGGMMAKYHEIREGINHAVSSLEKNLAKNVQEQTDEWAQKAKETLEYLKEQVGSLNPADHKELGVGLLAGVLLGGLLGAGTSLIMRDKLEEKKDNIMDTIGSKISTWKPILVELENLINKNSEECSKEPAHHDKMQGLLDFAVAGMKLWNTVKRK